MPYSYISALPNPALATTGFESFKAVCCWCTVHRCCRSVLLFCSLFCFVFPGTYADSIADGNNCRQGLRQVNHHVTTVLWKMCVRVLAASIRCLHVCPFQGLRTTIVDEMADPTINIIIVHPRGECYLRCKYICSACFFPGNTRPAAPVESEALHEALVSATWDAVAVMNALPKRYGRQRELASILWHVSRPGCNRSTHHQALLSQHRVRSSLV